MTTREGWAFGPWLAERREEARLSQNKLGRKIGRSGTLIRFLESGLKDGEPYHATFPVVKALSEVLAFNLDKGLELAGIPAEPDALRPTGDLREWTVYELLADLSQRYREAQERGLVSLPPARLTDEQVEQRGEMVARMDALASVAREAGDIVAADAVAALARQLNEQIEVMDAAEAVSEPHQNR